MSEAAVQALLLPDLLIVRHVSGPVMDSYYCIHRPGGLHPGRARWVDIPVGNTDAQANAAIRAKHAE
jgi:hypothetical protein